MGDHNAENAPQVVLGQIGEHVEQLACRECGRSASACGRTSSFCCQPCAGEPGIAGTSFLTHQPSLPPGALNARPGSPE